MWKETGWHNRSGIRIRCDRICTISIYAELPGLSPITWKPVWHGVSSATTSSKSPVQTVPKLSSGPLRSLRVVTVLRMRGHLNSGAVNLQW